MQNHLKAIAVSIFLLFILNNIFAQDHITPDDSLVQVFDVHYNYPDEPSSYEESGHLSRVDFSIKNLNAYPIKNIQILFVYKNYKGEVVSYSAKKIKATILPQLALQFYHYHEVKYFQKYQSEHGRFLEGKVEIRILDYEIDRASEVSPADLLFK